MSLWTSTTTWPPRSTSSARRSAIRPSPRNTSRPYRVLVTAFWFRSRSSPKKPLRNPWPSRRKHPRERRFLLFHAAGRRTPWIVGGATLLAAIVVLLLAVGHHKVSALSEKDSIIVADFSNGTGDAVFDDSLKTGLTLALDQSPFLNVLSEARSPKTLKADDQARKHQAHRGRGARSLPADREQSVCCRIDYQPGH